MIKRTANYIAVALNYANKKFFLYILTEKLEINAQNMQI